jgi:hypothetical protein
LCTSFKQASEIASSAKAAKKAALQIKTAAKESLVDCSKVEVKADMWGGAGAFAVGFQVSLVEFHVAPNILSLQLARAISPSVLLQAARDLKCILVSARCLWLTFSNLCV